MERELRIRKVLRNVTREPIEPALEESLFESGLLDSFTLPEFGTGLEREFHIAIPDGDLQPRKFDSIGKVIAYLDARSQ
jgi:acyl carrier protein